MKRRTIEKILNKKFDSFLESIDDKELQAKVGANTMITGGCITSMLLNEEVNDYDLYFTEVETTQAVAEYYTQKFLEINKSKKHSNGMKINLSVVNENGRIKIISKSAGIISESQTDNYEYFEQLEPGDPSSQEFIDNAITAIEGYKEKGKKYRPVFLTSNAITLSEEIQLVLRFYGLPEEIHENYDFIHCTNYWTSKERKVNLNERALESILTKELIYQGSKYPLCSIFRIRKFIQRGWTITAGQLLKMAYQVNELDLNNLNVLEDQLIGVDVAYFRELLEKIKSKDLEEVDTAYVIKLIDELV